MRSSLLAAMLASAAAAAPAVAQIVEPTAQDIKPPAAGDAAPREADALLHGVIEAIDPVNRRITVRDRDDRVALLHVAPEVQNFDRLFAGERVNVRVRAHEGKRPAVVAVEPARAAK